MEYFNAGCSPDFDNPTRQISVAVAQRFLEDAVRLAVQKHAEAAQNAVSFKSNAGKEFDLKFNKLICEEIQSVSDKWRGL